MAKARPGGRGHGKLQTATVTGGASGNHQRTARVRVWRETTSPTCGRTCGANRRAAAHVARVPAGPHLPAATRSALLARRVREYSARACPFPLPLPAPRRHCPELVPRPPLQPTLLVQRCTYPRREIPPVQSETPRRVRSLSSYTIHRCFACLATIDPTTVSHDLPIFSSISHGNMEWNPMECSVGTEAVRRACYTETHTVRREIRPLATCDTTTTISFPVRR